MQALPAAGAAFAVANHLVLDGSTAHAQPSTPLSGHFHPKGKAPSRFTLDVLKQARTNLPFADTRDFEEQKKGLIAPMQDLKIMADAGNVAWDMERFRFLVARFSQAEGVRPLEEVWTVVDHFNH